MYTLYITGYTGLVQKLSFDSSSLALVSESTKVGTSPSWLTVHDEKVYATDESEAGLVTVLDADLEVLGQWNAQSGAVSSDVTLDGKMLAVANYVAGSVDVFPLENGLAQDGKGASFNYTLKTPGPVAARQDKSYPHQAIFDPSGSLLFIPDLGMDQIHVYSRDTSSNSVTQLPSIQCEKGSGPRHVAFPSSGSNQFYSAHELSNVVTLWNYTISPFTATPIRSLSTLDSSSPLSIPRANLRPEGQKASEILLSPDNRFLYVGNRGGSTTSNDSIALYSIDSNNGEMTFVRLMNAGGRNLRHFSLSRDGRYVVCACQDSGEVIVWKRDARSGVLGEEPVARWEMESVTVAQWL